jgi:uncharacterized protein
MIDSQLPYEIWIEEALRGVVRRALEYTAAHSLPGEHHFYVTFVTGFEGVVVPPPLKAKYPNEMTIVLQHQFWDLIVGEDAFSVTLKFHGKPSELYIPFSAITAFGDPSVNFGLQLHAGGEEAILAARSAASDAEEASESADGAPGGQGADGAPHPGPDSGQVIALDTFRKK